MKYYRCFHLKNLHPPEITDQLGEFALRVSHVVPALVYDRVNAHTTLGTSQVRGNFAPDKDQLFALREVVLSVYGTHYDTLRGSALCCDEWAYNQEKVIVLGKPNEPFFHLLQALAQESLRQETALDTSSMSHLSANAFTQQCSPEELKEFFALMRSAPSLGESKPYCLDVGHFIASRSGIHVETYERFRIR